MDNYRAGLVAELERRRELTVVRPDQNGRPLSTTVAYCNDGAMIYFVVPGDSEAFSELEADAKVSLVLGTVTPRPLVIGLKHTHITLPPRPTPPASRKGVPVNALIAEVADRAERTRAVALLAARYPGLEPVMRRAHDNGFQMRMMRAVPFIGLAPSRPANAA